MVSKPAGNEQKKNGQTFWEILEGIIGKISSIIGDYSHKILLTIYIAFYS